MAHEVMYDGGGLKLYESSRLSRTSDANGLHPQFAIFLQQSSSFPVAFRRAVIII